MAASFGEGVHAASAAENDSRMRNIMFFIPEPRQRVTKWLSMSVLSRPGRTDEQYGGVGSGVDSAALQVASSGAAGPGGAANMSPLTRFQKVELRRRVVT